MKIKNKLNMPPSNTEIQEIVNKKLEQDLLEESIQYLEENAPSGRLIQNLIILFKGNLSQLNNDKRRGIASSDDLTIGRNSLRIKIQSLVEDLEYLELNEDLGNYKSFNENQLEKKLNYIIFLLVFILLAIVALIFS